VLCFALPFRPLGTEWANDHAAHSVGVAGIAPKLAIFDPESCGLAYKICL